MKFHFLHTLSFKNRKLVHYALLACIILIQLIAVLTWYNETIHEDQLNESLKNFNLHQKISQNSNEVNKSILNAQQYFNIYLRQKNQDNLNRYIASVKNTGVLIDSLNQVSQKSEAFKEIIRQKKQTENDIVLIQSTIDSIINFNLSGIKNNDKVRFELKKIVTNKFLDSVDTNTFVKVDSVSRKGLLGRLMDAFSGRIEIQKEQLNTIVTLKFKDKITTGTLEEQLKNVVLTINRYYELEFLKLQKGFALLRNKDLELIRYNNDMLLLYNRVLPHYAAAAEKLKNSGKKDFETQYRFNKAIRKYTVVALLLLMLFISVLLFGFTRLAFEYERRLTISKEKIKQNLNFKNRIISMVSHEIRSPLSIISLYSQKLSKLSKDEVTKETYQSIDFTTKSLLLLSNQILEFSKDENHTLQLKSKKFFLQYELDQITNSLRTLVEAKGNKFVLSSDITEEFEVYNDLGKLHQLFYNIVGNANKFTEKGTVSISIQHQLLSEFELELEVTVTDSGVGISKEGLARIFEPYYQDNNEKTGNEFGVGLGLYLCKEIVTILDGSIHAESTEGKGTKVSFKLTFTLS